MDTPQASRTSSSRVDASIELPQLIPLSHAHPALSSSEPFDVDAFLLSRSGQSLQDLRSELRGYLGGLKEELVQLINDDYAAFISLSTDLKGEGTRLERLAAPLPGLRAEIEVSVSLEHLATPRVDPSRSLELEKRTSRNSGCSPRQVD